MSAPVATVTPTEVLAAPKRCPLPVGSLNDDVTRAAAHLEDVKRDIAAMRGLLGLWLPARCRWCSAELYFSDGALRDETGAELCSAEIECAYSHYTPFLGEFAQHPWDWRTVQDVLGHGLACSCWAPRSHFADYGWPPPPPPVAALEDLSGSEG
jgi:hypothetical protein